MDENNQTWRALSYTFPLQNLIYQSWKCEDSNNFFFHIIMMKDKHLRCKMELITILFLF